ncbi:sialate O-acetylesterase [Termitidicoccus mucosus]|uniref:Sialate O-acetylesterase n=2 Tax=Termitidicoccus mucosus TaxID=1184151 RepID=A0A178IBE1_9BACT|nr:sialate O-acetylesterase [Opitutaceae bacterium TSB47]
MLPCTLRIMVLSFLLPCAALIADVIPVSLFNDGMVLQHGKSIPVWGTANNGEKIQVRFAEHSATTVADDKGQWRAWLPALAPSSEGRRLVISGNNTVTIKDVLVGEVWLASGQSNMEWTVARAYDARFEAIAARHPLIRQFLVSKKVSEQPQSRVIGKWTKVTPESVGQFSAVAYFFALDLHRVLDGIPVGILHSSWGGSRVEAWMDAATIANGDGPEFAGIHTRWQETLARWPAAKASVDAAIKRWEEERSAAQTQGKTFSKPKPQYGRGPGHMDTPCGLYNAMIAPLVPYALRGAIWYQGESNAQRAHEYRAFFSAMIEGWRREFGQGDFPFYWVQLANYRANGPDETSYAFLREAQTQTLALPNTGQAVTIDIGNVTDIHPRNKRNVGRRLALVALATTYGKTSLTYSGPVFLSAKREGDSSMRVLFDTGGSPLTSPLALQPEGFEIAGADKVFHPADTRIDGESVIISSPGVSAPVAVRYAWRNAPKAGLFNQDGLPATPFRTDDW